MSQTTSQPQSSPLIDKNITKEGTHKYLYTSMVSHQGTPVSFAMRADGKIFYSVLNMLNTEQNAEKSDDNDKNYWSKVNFEGNHESSLHFPQEISQVGYSVVPNFQIDKYDSNNQKIIQSYDSEGKPLDGNNNKLSLEAIKDKTDPFFSSTAKLGAKTPFQVLSDTKHIYVFRQSVAGDDTNNETPALVNNTLLVDRFILSGTVLKPSREIRYQRSRHKTEPESRKDTLSAVDVEGKPFYEPTRELVFANNLTNGKFSVLLVPGADSEEQRWQIFTTNAGTKKVNSFNIRFDNSIVFDTTDSQTVVDEFIEKYKLDEGLISRVQTEINNSKDDIIIANALLHESPYSGKKIPKDALAEVVYTIRTGVAKDDFIMTSVSEWPLIEYESDNTTIKADYLVNGALKAAYTFQGRSDELKPESVNYTPGNGLSSCYYYQQEMGADSKPMKNNACVMLAMGLEDKDQNKYIGILNFAVAASGRLSQLTTDTVNMPDINVQALDENPYDTLNDIPTDDKNRVAWQEPQKMKLLDIDPNGLSTTGGVLKFAYTSAGIGISQGYSDAVEATDCYLFDDSLGRVNLYFKGKNNNFFVLYFNPTGSRSVAVTSSNSQAATPPLSLKPRLDRDMDIHVTATLPANSNTCTLTMKSQGEAVEQWDQLPRRFSQISGILNGNSELPLGTLEPLGNTTDPRAAYIKPRTGNGTLSLRTTVDNNLLFQVTNAYAAELAEGQTHAIALSGLSAYLSHNTGLHIAKRSFALTGNVDIVLKADMFYRSYLSGVVNEPGDINLLWGHLKTLKLVSELSEAAIANTAQDTIVSEAPTFLTGDTTLTVTSVAGLGITEGDYLQIDNEILRVLHIYGNDIAVSRGQLGTVAADHSNGAKVSYNKCRLNGAVTTDAVTFKVTSAADLGMAKGDYISIGNEILLVTAVSGNDITVVRGQENSTASSHNNGSVVTIHEKGITIVKGYLKAAGITGTEASLNALIADSGIDNLALQLLQEGNTADKNARRARLKQSLIALLLDVAKVRIVTFTVQDTNTQSVDRLEAGLAVSVMYDYTNFTCTPARLGETSAPVWEHSRSYLFNASTEYNETIDAATEIDSTFNYDYDINNTIGQWEGWEASLALELNPTSATDGALLSTTTDSSSKLEALQPTEKGISAEAWVKPSAELNNPGSILYYKKGDRHYALGIEKDKADATKYKCVASLGDKKYTSKKAFAFKNARDNRQWRHLAFTHKKYWGYQLNKGNTINCGNDSSLQLDGEFSLEVLVKIDTSGTLLEKKEEYSLKVNSSNEVVFNWAGMDYLSDNPYKLDALNKFYKITVIRSRNKPQMDPTKKEYPITEDDQGRQAGSKWYEGKSTDEMIKGMAEKQDQMDSKMNFSKTNMFGNTENPSSDDYNPKYYHTLIVTGNDNRNPKEWTTSTPREVEPVEVYKDFIMGGDGFSGTFASVRIWNRALSKSEAKARALPENKTGLLSHWRIAEGKGSHLYDAVSENHGVANGGMWADSPQTDQEGQFQFYVDGSPEAHDTPVKVTAQGVDQLSIGGIKKNTGFANHFKGALEEIRIWNVPRTNEQITDNAFGRLKGEWEQLLANYTFDKPISQTDDKVQDASVNSVHLTVHNNNMLTAVLSTAPIATEIPQVRSALTGVLTAYNSAIHSRPGVVEYGDVQKNEDGTMNGILKRCYSFIDADQKWNRMTGYKVGNLVSQWHGQAQFAPQVMGYLEGPPPVPAENFPVGKDADVDTYAYILDNSISFNQAEEVSYNYSTSKDAGWNTAVESEANIGGETRFLIAPLGIGESFALRVGAAAESNWETSGQRSQSYERGVSVNTEQALSAALAGYDNGKSGAARYYKLGNTGYALVKSKTADIYLLRLAHNNALVSINWQPNPDIPEDVNILPFPINPLYTKQGTLDGKFGETTDDHYPQAQGAYGQYSYFKPREAYKLKKQIEREKMELKAYFEDSFDVSKTNAHFQGAAAGTGLSQLSAFIPAGWGTFIASGINQTLGQVATQVGYNNTELKEDLAKMGSQRNLVNTYVWTVEGGFYAETTEVAETQQETYANETSLSLGGSTGMVNDVESGFMFEQKSLFSSGSSFTLTKSKTKESSSSFGLDVSVDIPTSPRYKYSGSDGLALTKGLIGAGTVDAYRFMSFYLEPKGQHFTDLFTKVIDPIWLDESPDPNAQALRQARGNVDKAKPCWRIMHRVTYVSRILPEFQPEAPPSLEKSMRASGMESNYMLIKKFEPYIAHISDSGAFFTKIEELINTQLPEFAGYKKQIKNYLALYFNIDEE